MLKKYEAWETSDGVIFAPLESIEDSRAKGLHGPDAKFLYCIEASTWEEAQAIHHLRMGWGAWNPMSEPARCPGCASWFYPELSGECWQCGKIC